MRAGPTSPTLHRLAVGLLLLAAPAMAMAVEVYLNGVKITGVRDQTFEKATVRIDARGDVHIDAPAYRVAGAQTAAPAPAAPAAPQVPTGAIQASKDLRFFLVTFQNVKGMTQYEIDVYVNSKWVRNLRSKDEQLHADISRHFVVGENKVLLVARKTLEDGRKSDSPGHFFRVLIGQGNEGGNNIMLERSLVDFKRTAADVEDVSREYTIYVK